MTAPMTPDVTAIYQQARAAFAMEICALERDARVSELTADEIDSIIHAIISLPAVRGRLDEPAVPYHHI